MVQFCNQLDAMQSMKDQLEQRTKMIEANIQRQQDELRQIQEELQRVQGHSLQVVQRDHPLGRGCFYVASFALVLTGFLSSPRCSCRKEPVDST